MVCCGVLSGTRQCLNHRGRCCGHNPGSMKGRADVVQKLQLIPGGSRGECVERGDCGGTRYRGPGVN